MIAEVVNESHRVRTIREIILDLAKQYVTKDRNTTAGEPENNFAAIAKMWSVYLGARRMQGNITKHDVAVLMILVKVARIAVSPEKEDHWIDIAGYAACGGECADIDKVK